MSDPRNKPPGNVPDPSLEPGLEHDLEPVRTAWSQLETVEPPQMLDQAVLNTARRQLEPPPTRRRLRWIGAFATAAVVVLALGIVIKQDPRPPAATVEQSNGIRLDPVAPTGSRDKVKLGEAEEKREHDAPPALLKDTGEASRRQALKSAMPESAAVSATAADAPGEEALQGSPAMENLHEDFSDAVPSAEPLPEPGAWIERLTELKSSVSEEEFKRELEAFRAAYPAYPIPAELAD